MKSRLTAISLFVLLLLGSSAQAKDVCSDIRQTACNSLLSLDIQRRVMLKTIEVRKRAFARIAKRPDAEQIVASLNKFSAFAGSDLSSEQGLAYAEILQQSAVEVSAVDDAQVKNEVRAILDLIKKSVIEKTANSLDVRRRMLEQLERIEIFNVAELMKAHPLHGMKFIPWCGQYALQPYGYQLTLSGSSSPEDRFVVICPALIANWSLLRPWATFVIAHELGHRIDSGTGFYNEFKPLLQCASEHKNNRAFFAASVSNTLTELIADQWAANVIARMNPTEDFIRQAEIGFCGMMKAQNFSPGGLFRQIQLLAHPGIRAALQCTEPPEVPYCGI